MRRILISIVVVVVAAAAVGYATGVFTTEERREDGCPVCRAIRYTGRQYGVSYERVDDSVFTDWYRRTIDPLHGLDPEHPHAWEHSAGAVIASSVRGGKEESAEGVVAPVFMLRPEIELEAVRHLPDQMSQARVIRSLHAASRATSARRVKMLIRAYYVDSKIAPWSHWWRRHARQYGLALPRTTARR